METLQFEEDYELLSTTITKHGEDWHKEIDNIVYKLKTAVDKMRKTRKQTLQEYLDGINKTISNISDEIESIEIALNTNDSSKLNGSINEPETVNGFIDTGYNKLYNVACLSDEEIWTNENDSTMKIYSINRGSLLKSISTKSKCNTSESINTEQLHQMFGSLSALSIKREEKGFTIIPLPDEPELITTINTGHQRLYSVTCLSDEEIWTRGYTGHPSTTGASFNPVGITTDSQSQILTTDLVNAKPSFVKEILRKDLRELEKRIQPSYDKIASDFNSEKLELEKHCEKLTAAVTKRGEDWHREIDNIVNIQKSEINEMKTKHLAVLNQLEIEIKQITFEVEQSILDLKKLQVLDPHDVSIASTYKSRNAEFRSLPLKVKVSIPSFSPHQINREQLLQMFSSLSALSITTEERGYIMKTPYLQGNRMKSIKTKPGNIPLEIAVTGSGDLVYTDPGMRSVNVVKNKQIQEVIRLQGWTPRYVCSTSSGDLLVTMVNDVEEQSKVVRYSGSTEKQTIQLDSEGKPLYSSGNFNTIKYISENRNLDS
ncbi:uncharacterized protein LOC134276238 [Saccostrea cucullata]|uniref:uncharacterized protein LOC134276238 n=1 Tax=Saccostrea cuccullata TaxID=36930 RepID=UPI002ED30CAC